MFKCGKKIIAALVLLALGACSTLGAEDPKRAALLLRLGTSQIEGGDYPAALKSLLEAERYDNTDHIIQNNLGIVYFFRGHHDQAEKHLRRATELKPEFTDAKNNLARVLIEKGESNEAIKLLEKVLDDLTYDRPAKATLNLGIAYFRLKKFDEARSHFTKALKYGRDNCLANNYLGRSFFEEKNYKNATTALDHAVSFCKNLQFDEPHYYSALSYYLLGEKQKAEVRLEEVIKTYSRGKYTEQARNLLETIRQ